jgi:hypothetical protein
MGQSLDHARLLVVIELALRHSCGRLRLRLRKGARIDCAGKMTTENAGTDASNWPEVANLLPLEKDDVHKAYSAISDRLDHEAKVSSDRIAWALSLTGGLFAASAILITIIVLGKPTQTMIGILVALMAGIALVGVLLSAISLVGVWAAYGQFAELRRCYKEGEAQFKALKLPRPTGNDRAHKIAGITAGAFPGLMLACWIVGCAFTTILACQIFGLLEQTYLYKLWPGLKQVLFDE